VRQLTWSQIGRTFGLSPYDVRRTILDNRVRRLYPGGRSVVLDTVFASAVGNRDRCCSSGDRVEMAKPPEGQAPRASHELSTEAPQKPRPALCTALCGRDRTREKF
jgi:hypothetical protein